MGANPMTHWTTRNSSRLIGWASVLAAAAGHAPSQAGGQFEVDDAGTQRAGECLVESWGGHARRSEIDFLHVGPACGVGAVELALNWDYARTQPDVHLLGPQIKWTFVGREDDAPLSMAVLAGAQHDLRDGGRWGGQGALILSWQVLAPLQFNANLGADWAAGDGERSVRGGVQLQWAVRPDFTLVAERNHSLSQWGTRAGFSWQAGPDTSIDFSVARLGLGGGETVFTVGLNQQFGMPGRR